MPGRSECIVGRRSVKVSSNQLSTSLVDPLQVVLPLLDLLVLILSPTSSSALQSGFVKPGWKCWLPLLLLLLLVLVESHIDIMVHAVIVAAVRLLNVAGHADHH